MLACTAAPVVSCETSESATPDSVNVAAIEIVISALGLALGLAEGRALGEDDGDADGDALGRLVGLVDGITDGETEGLSVLSQQLRYVPSVSGQHSPLR